MSACCKKILETSGIPASAVKGVGFDATCSLTVVNTAGEPISVSRSGAGDAEGEESDANVGQPGEWNVILWADHRATEEAEKINASGEGVLNFVGGTMSVCLVCRRC